MAELGALDAALLPAGVRARFAAPVNGLRVHLLEAGFEPDAGQAARPLILLLHGFPEIAYSFRKVMGPLAAAGFHVVAPDLRGYGRTTGAPAGYDVDLGAFGMLEFVRDAVALVAALGRREVAMVAGHDYGSGVAGACALVRPDVFRSVALMSAPFPGPPAWPGIPGPSPAADFAGDDPTDALAALEPPRQHYHWYYSTPSANADMVECRQGLHAFLRAYFHHKSADWAGNRPHPLSAWSAAELAKLPTYYVMRRDETMAETVAHVMPSPDQVAACRWLPDAELAVYAAEYARTGFQGGLNGYRVRTTGLLRRELSTFAGRSIDVPSCFFAGAEDWGTFQKAGDFERMQSTGCTDMRACALIDGAGHWLQQEQPDALVARLLDFVASSAR